MARPTRQARRERREQQREDRERDGNGSGGRRPPTAAATAEPQPIGPEPEALQQGVKHRGGVIGFIGECIAELKKVEWPGQKQVITGTVVVIVACTLVGIYLWGIDSLIVKPLIQRLI